MPAVVQTAREESDEMYLGEPSTQSLRCLRDNCKHGDIHILYKYNSVQHGRLSEPAVVQTARQEFDEMYLFDFDEIVQI